MLDYSEDFDIFFKKYFKIMVFYVMSGKINSCDAEEIVNTAFTRLWERWNIRCEFEEQSNLKWMYNTVEYVKMERRKRKRIPTDDLESYISNVDSDDAIDQFIERQQYEYLQKKILQKLSGADAELYKLKFIEQLSYSEIEKRLGITNQTLRTRISRLKDKLAYLREELKK